MKLMYGNVPVKSLNIKHFEVDTNSATVRPSDLQAGVTCFGRGQKITGTGKSFEFASYGGMRTNEAQYIPTNINVIEVSSLGYPIKLTIALSDMKNVDFTVAQVIANIVIDGATYDVIAQAANNSFTLSCDKTIDLEVFYGKDNYV